MPTATSTTEPLSAVVTNDDSTRLVTAAFSTTFAVAGGVHIVRVRAAFSATYVQAPEETS